MGLYVEMLSVCLLPWALMVATMKTTPMQVRFAWMRIECYGM
jgi:hypothetical protein